MAEKKTRLIIVVTRADAPKGGGEDEFVQEWGFAADDPPFQWPEVNASEDCVLVLHGCDETKGKLPKIFDKAIKQNKAICETICEAWFCHHGMTPKDSKKLEKKIRHTFSDLSSDNFKSYPYSSLESGPAVDNLLEKLPEDLATAMGDIFKGRLIFVKRLHALQSCLLRLQFCIAILYLDVKTTGKEYRLQAIEEAPKIVKDIGKTIGFDGFVKYLDEIKRLAAGRDDTQAAVELVRVLSRNKPKDDKRILSALQFWHDCTEQVAYEHLPERKKLEDDFRLFAMALDCLMDESSRLQN